MRVNRDAVIHRGEESEASRRAADTCNAVLEVRNSSLQAFQSRHVDAVRFEGQDSVAPVQLTKTCGADAIVGTDVQEETVTGPCQVSEAVVTLVVRKMKRNLG